MCHSINTPALCKDATIPETGCGGVHITTILVRCESVHTGCQDVQATKSSQAVAMSNLKQELCPVCRAKLAGRDQCSVDEPSHKPASSSEGPSEPSIESDTDSVEWTGFNS